MNPQNSLAASHSEELPWLAFRYVSEELTPKEAQDFEERLMSDQAAREAVAQAMKMSEGLWMASAMDSLHLQPKTTPTPLARETGSQTIRERLRSMSWLVSTVVAASLAFCIGWWFAQRQTESRSTPAQNIAQSQSQESAKAKLIPTTDVEGAEQLLEFWTESESLLAELESGPAVEYPAGDLNSRENPDSEEDSFSWMLAAVSATSIPPTQPAVMEN